MAKRRLERKRETRDGFSPTIMRKMGKMLNEALGNNARDPEHSFVIEHAHLVARRRLTTPGPQRDRLDHLINKSEETGVGLGFAIGDIKNLRGFVSEEDQAGRLNRQKLEEKVGTNGS